MLIFDENAGEVKNYNGTYATLDEAITFACNQVEIHAARLRAKVLNPISPYEAASWPIKQSEAAKVVGGGQSDMINLEATSRGITANELANKVLEKATLFAGLEAILAGISGRHRDTIKLLPTISDVDLYDWSVGWPEL